MDEQHTLYRLMPGELARPDPRTLTGIAVRYDTPTTVTDLLPNGEYETYREGFRASAFARGFDQPHRVRLVDGHLPDGSYGPDVGIATSMRSEDGGLVVDFRVFDRDASKVETLLDVGVRGLSVGFKPAKGGSEKVDGVVWRTRAQLQHVALVPDAAYSGAEVVAFRGEPDDLATAELEYDEKVAELEEFLARARAEQDEWAKRLEG